MGKSTCSRLDVSASLGIVQYWCVCSTPILKKAQSTHTNTEGGPERLKRLDGNVCSCPSNIVIIDSPKRHWEIHRGRRSSPVQQKIMHGEWSISWLPRICSHELLESPATWQEKSTDASFIFIPCLVRELYKLLGVSSECTWSMAFISG